MGGWRVATKSQWWIQDFEKGGTMISQKQIPGYGRVRGRRQYETMMHSCLPISHNIIILLCAIQFVTQN